MHHDKLIQLYKKHSTTVPSGLSRHAKERVKNRIFQQLNSPAADMPRIRAPQSWSFFFMRFSAVAVVILVVLTGTAYASSNSLPGDILYPLKRAVENTQLTFTSSPESKARLQVEFTEKRLAELETIETQAAAGAAVTDIPSPSPQAKETPGAQKGSSTREAPAVTTGTTAEQKARVEVSRALNVLEKAQQSLDKKGKNQEAENVGKAILRLKARAEHRRENRGSEDADDEQSNDGKSGNEDRESETELRLDILRQQN